MLGGVVEVDDSVEVATLIHRQHTDDGLAIKDFQPVEQIERCKEQTRRDATVKPPPIGSDEHPKVQEVVADLLEITGDSGADADDLVLIIQHDEQHFTEALQDEVVVVTRQRRLRFPELDDRGVCLRRVVLVDLQQFGRLDFLGAVATHVVDEISGVPDGRHGHLQFARVALVSRRRER